MEINKLYETFFRIGDMIKPYSSDAEYVDDLLRFLDLCLVPLLSAKGMKDDSLPAREAVGSVYSLSVAPADAARIIAERRLDIAPDGLTDEVREQVGYAYSHIEARRKRSAKKDFIARFDIICRKFVLNDVERFAMLLAFSSAYDRKYEAAYCVLHNNNGDHCPTKWLAVRLYRYLFGEAAGTSRLIDGSSPLIRFLCDSSLKRRDRADSAERLVLTKRAAAYILGRNLPDPELAGYCRIADYGGVTHVPVHGEELERIRRIYVGKAFDDKGAFVLNICGPRGIGRRYAAWRAVTGTGLVLLDIDLSALIASHEDDLRRYLDMIYTEATLLGAVVCFTADRETPEAPKEGGNAGHISESAVKEAARYITSLFGFCFWITTEKDDPFAGTGAGFVSEELPTLTANERRLFWETDLPQKLTGDEVSLFANRYILTPGSIADVSRTAADIAETEGGQITSDIMTRSVRQHSSEQFGTFATRINAVFTWDDLVVSDDQKRKMRMICDQVKYRSVVNEDWGFRKKSPYGRGLCALFYGSPGTGKTMAVQVMANELGLDLYRIDLSQLSSKYIGETQKNIAELFRRAKNINAMLFFDEADSMFAKRSEVKDSNDRYANADTAFLLQKLEDYEGITILATNYVNNIDDAFKRRIKFMINFVFPTADVRLMLWKKILPESARVDEDIDFEFFADNFELPGSNIKEILTNAAFLAASEGTGLRNDHIIEAVKLNYSKYGKILTNDDFGYLSR